MQVLVFIVDHKLDYFAVLEHKRIGVDAVDYWIGAVVADGEGGVKRRNLLGDVGDVVDGETGDTVIGRVIHGQSYSPVYRLE